MSVFTVVTFVMVFVLVLLAVSLGTKFYESRRKKQVTGMLQTLAGRPVVTITKLLKDLEPSDLSLLQRVLKSVDFPKRAGELIQQAGLTWTPMQYLGFILGGAAVGIVAGIRFPMLLGAALSCLVFAVLGGSLPYFYLRRKRTKRLAEVEAQLPEALDFLARSMRAGHAFTISLEMVGEELGGSLGLELRALCNEHNLGAPLDVALDNFSKRIPLLDVRFFSSSVLLQRQTGGNLSEILNRLAYVIRERFRLKGQVKAASAHGRMTAGILTVLPIATMAGLLFVAPGYLQGMAADPDGRNLIMGAVIAQILGNYCINRIIKIKV